MENRFIVRRVEQDPAANQHQMTLVGGLTGPADPGPPHSAHDIFNSTSTTCLCEPADRRPSIVHLTKEALPRVDYYSNALEGMKRPSLGDLHGDDPCGKLPPPLPPSELSLRVACYYRPALCGRGVDKALRRDIDPLSRRRLLSSARGAAALLRPQHPSTWRGGGRVQKGRSGESMEGNEFRMGLRLGNRQGKQPCSSGRCKASGHARLLQRGTAGGRLRQRESCVRVRMQHFRANDADLEQQHEAADVGGGHGIKLGWIQGVLIPCLLNIWGVMLFLRLSWVVAQSGIAQTLIIIAVSAVVCVLTTLSMSAISTNGEVKGGGIYYIISRSLGPEFGASIGLVFAFANAVAASMNTIGFCNSLNDLLKSQGLQIVDGDVNDVRIVGVIALLVMVLICAVGMEWESKAQNFLIAIIMGAIVDFIAGTIVGPNTDDEKAKGFVGFDVEVLRNNWGPSYRFSENVDQTFFSVFAIFFPSVTGIQAGANISGDLKDPAAAIPKGTLLALLLSMVSYAVFVVFAGGAALRDASGNVTELASGAFSDCSGRPCDYGLMNSYSVSAHSASFCSRFTLAKMHREHGENAYS
ncbi:Uncharacterized protein GBIM_18200 [Gryllus bimaculatus]|nr:Uncharacterized protein GBIM_18200 [Gryllus bimaculatus]